MAQLAVGERIQRAIVVAPIYEYIRSHGIRHAFVFTQLGISRSRMQQIETGMCPTPPDFIESVCAILDIPVTRLYPNWPETDPSSYLGIPRPLAS